MGPQSQGGPFAFSPLLSAYVSKHLLLVLVSLLGSVLRTLFPHPYSHPLTSLKHALSTELEDNLAIFIDE